MEADKHAATNSEAGLRETGIHSIGNNLKKLTEKSTQTTSAKARPRASPVGTLGCRNPEIAAAGEKISKNHRMIDTAVQRVTISTLRAMIKAQPKWEISSKSYSSTHGCGIWKILLAITKRVRFDMEGKRLRIPNEDVRLTADEVAVTQTRMFQRLFDLKQLGLAFLVYPSAVQTRGDHSIRCLGEAEKILQGLRNSEHEISQTDASSVRMAALLHDIGHLAFSHTLEDEHAVLSKHDRPERLQKAIGLLKEELDEQVQCLVDNALPILHMISEKDVNVDWRGDLVGNTVCADLLAYIKTDAEWTGIEKRPGHYRIYEYFTINEETNRLCIRLTKGGLRNDIISAVMDLLDMRYSLTERVIFHHAKCVASSMLARAARLCGICEDHVESLLPMGDERFLFHLEQIAQDSQAAADDGNGAVDLLRSLKSRRLYQRIFKVTPGSREEWDASKETGAFCKQWRNPDEVEKLLSSIEDDHELPRGALVLWCPEAPSGMKLVETNVVWESATGMHGPIKLREIGKESEQFAGVAKRVQTIEEQYLDLWTFWIAMDRKFVQKAPVVVQALERRLHIECNPVFRETYLCQIDGFEQSWKNLNAVTDALGGRLVGPVAESLGAQSLLDGKNHFDEAAILGAAKDKLETITPPRKRSSRRKGGKAKSQEDIDPQRRLIPPEPPADEHPAKNQEDDK